MPMDPRYWNFDVDRYLNRVVPPPPWKHLPYSVARFFGYRKEGDQPEGTGNLLPVFWAFIGVFCGVSVIEAVSQHIPSFAEHGAPLIVGSFGAAAVLEFYVIESPLAQPRNAIFGQLISAIVGCAVCRLFLLSDNFESLQWLGGALACAAATSLMALTKTVHPPAGATALLAVTDSKIVALGWFLIPVMLLGSCLIVTVALIVNNIMRRFPVYWWTPEDLRRGTRHEMVETKPASLHRRHSSIHSSSHHHHHHGAPMNSSSIKESKGSEDRDPEAALVDSGMWVTPSQDDTPSDSDVPEIVIRAGKIVVPQHVLLTQEEKLLLESMSNRL